VRAVAGQRRGERTRSPAAPAADRALQQGFAVGGVLLVLLVVVKAVRVAHMDLTTAQALLTHGDVPGVVTGILLLFFPALVPLALLVAGAGLAAWFRGLPRAPARESRRGRIAALLAAVATVGALLLVMFVAVPAAAWQYPLAVGGFMGAAYAGDRLAARFTRRRRAAAMPDWLALPVLVVIASYILSPVFLTLFNDSVWLPPERLRLEGRPAVTAYEIGSNDRRVLFLLEDTRAVVAVVPDDIVDQQPCRLERYVNSRPSLYDRWRGAPPPATAPC
jgi:hypothetical protein